MKAKFRRFYIMCAVMGVLLLAQSQAYSQDRSEDRDKPTPITANEVTDDLDGSDDEYFYVFTVGPGTLKITFDVEAAGTNAGATFDFFDAKAKAILSNVLVQGIDKGSERVVKTIKSAKAREIVMRVKGMKYGSSGGNGIYKIRFEGPMVTNAPVVPPVEQPVIPPVEKPFE